MHIDIDEIAKTFGATTALHPVSLNIPSGALVALLGPSGVGVCGGERRAAGAGCQGVGSSWRRTLESSTTPSVRCQ